MSFEKNFKKGIFERKRSMDLKKENGKNFSKGFHKRNEYHLDSINRYPHFLNIAFVSK
jgi:hypothetical protein